MYRILFQVCGIRYHRGVQSSLLPEVPADADRVPESYLLQIVKKPKLRSDRKPITRFTLLTPVNQVCLSASLQSLLLLCLPVSPASWVLLELTLPMTVKQQ